MSVPGENLQIQSRAVAQPFRWPLAELVQVRGTSLLQDAHIVNGYIEKDPVDAEIWVYKRFGINASPLLSAGGSAYSRGMFYDGVSGNLYSFDAATFNTTTGTLRINNFIHATQGTIGSVNCDVTGMPMSWTSCGPISSGAQVLYHDAVNGYVINTVNNTQVTITDPNFPGNASLRMVYGAVELDGWIFVMDSRGGIWNTATPNAPTTWSGTGLIFTSQDPSPGVGIVRCLNYLVGFTRDQGQVFYDAGNPTGSPLSPVPDAYIPYGCSWGPTLQQMDGMVFWVGTAYGGQPQVLMLNNLSPSVVSIPSIDKLLTQLNISPTVLGEPPYSAFDPGVYGWTLKWGGHRFYGITCVQLNITLVYDVDQQFWTIWTDANGNFFPAVAMSFNRAVNTSLAAVTNLVPAAVYMQTYGTGNVSQLDTCFVFPTDAGAIPAVDIFTPNQDFGTVRRKTIHNMYFRADKVNARLQVRHTDDDFQTYSNFRSVDLNLPKPVLRNEGTFEWRRAYHFRHQAATAFRIKSADLQMDVGLM